MVYRDKRVKGSTKWQKGKINLAMPSDLHGLLPASSDPKQSADAHTWIYTACLSLLPCSWLCLASYPHTAGRYSLFLGLQEGGGWDKEEEAAARMWGQRGSARFSSNFPTMTVLLCPPHHGGDFWSQTNMGDYMGYVTLCVSDGQTAMVLACSYIIYTATDRFLLSNQDSGQSGTRDRNSYICAHTVKDVKGWCHLVLGARVAYYGHSAGVTSCLYSNILILMANNIQKLFSVPDVVSVQM